MRTAAESVWPLRIKFPVRLRRFC